ncbi:CU044_2847 family protein [Streptomyces sp. NPDC056524]|uniref:CU044_2847 family protein n=1 Tax=Streptomyces sp. NPDC056524 TaxID=3345851 RepID=UPI0036D03DEB
MGQQLARIALDGGGTILVEAAEAEEDGPVKASGLPGDAIRELPVRLGQALEPVTDLARTVLGRLRDAGPAELEVEFGIDLSTEAGVVITKAQAACHLTVRMVWHKDQTGSEPVATASDVPPA